MEDNIKNKNELIIAVSNQYIMKYYSDGLINALPEDLQDQIKLILVGFTEECGGILELIYNNEFNDITFKTYSEDIDFTYDEIEAKYKLSKLEKEYESFWAELAKYIKSSLENKDNNHTHIHDDNHKCDCGCEHEHDKN